MSKLVHLTGLALAVVATSAAAAPAPTPSAPAVPPSTSQALTLKVDHDDGAEHMCPANSQLTSYQANAILDNAPVVVELLGPDHKPLPDKTWSTVAGLRILPLVQGPLRITMICAAW